MEEPEGLSFLGLKKDPEYVNADISNLLEYLEGLTDFLVEARKKRYTKSIMKLKVESLKMRLKGHRGLLESLAEKEKGKESSDVKEKTESSHVSNNDIENTLDYIKGLTGFLPENRGGEAMNLKLQKLLEKIEEGKNG